MNSSTSEYDDDSLRALRPSRSSAKRLRAIGAWRDGQHLSDLAHWRDTTPEAIAVYAHTAQSGATTRLTYAQYATYVERFSGALYDLGVRPGRVVAVQLPNRWQTSALMLAVIRAGAILAPIATSLRPRELERVLRRLRATVCVTTDQWDGFEHSAVLAEMAPRLPHLRKRVVLGKTVAEDEIDFARHFEQTPWDETHPMPLHDAQVDPDRVALALLTSGTTGEPKTALHTLNTHYAGYHPFSLSEGFGPRDRFFTPHPLTHGSGLLAELGLPLLTGGAAVLLDTWEPRAALELLLESDTSMIAASPVSLSALTAAARREAASLPVLRAVMSFGMAITSQVVEDVANVFALPLRNAWGMTEASGTHTRDEGPVDWAVHSVGRPGPGTELDLRPVGQDSAAARPARLFIRGGSVCLATMGRDSGELRIIADHDDGWYDTGDLAIPDGRGGIQVVGRAAEL